MTGFDCLDFEPIARQVYDAFLIELPNTLVEGLFECGGKYFIVSPAVEERRNDGRTVAEWFNSSRRPLGMPIHLVSRRPEGAVELGPRSSEQVALGFGVVRSLIEVVRELGVRLAKSFPLLSVTAEKRVLIVTVSRVLDDREQRALAHAVTDLGVPAPFEVRVDTDGTPAIAERTAKLPFVLRTARLHPHLPALIRAFLEEDEAFWRSSFHAALRGQLRVEQALDEERRPAGSACLVATAFEPGNIRSYLSLYSEVVLVLPLAERLNGVLTALGVTRQELVELVERRRVRLIAPQSIERYDAAFLSELLEVRPSAVTGSRRLATAVHAEQTARNPLLVFPGTAIDRRTLLRAFRRAADEHPDARPIMMALADGLATAWPNYEHTLHVRGAMTSLVGPLAQVSRQLAMGLTGNDHFLELGSAAQNVEWAAAIGAHYAPLETDEYSELAHCELLLAIQGGVPRGALPLALASRFEVAQELLVVDNDVDIIDFVTALGEGDMLRFRDLVRSLARPGRPAEEVKDLVTMWNRQVRRYERRPDRLKSMGLGGFLLGTTAKVVGAPDVLSLSTAVLPLLPAILTVVQEDLVGERASLGTAMDDLNARLAGVQREAVLLARLRKLVKGMKG